jgi:hypothetical protein
MRTGEQLLKLLRPVLESLIARFNGQQWPTRWVPCLEFHERLVKRLAEFDIGLYAEPDRR